jgi:hypothetical protein
VIAGGEVQVPLIYVVLPPLIVLLVLWFVAWNWMWNRFVAPPLRRWIWRRLGLTEEEVELAQQHDWDQLIEDMDMPDRETQHLRVAAERLKRRRREETEHSHD